MTVEFKEFGFRPEIQESLATAGYSTATPIQERAIPLLIRGTDLIGIAATGTGKTLAFLLPMFQRMTPGDRDPQAVVICPTRELAIQVAGEAERFGAKLGVRTVLTYGGTSTGDQKRSLDAGCDLVVATPGRLLDFVNSAWLSLRRVRWVVLDEADRMLDMGFINDVDAILRRTPMSRQTMLFSATFPEEIAKLSERYMLHPERVEMHTGTRVTSNVNHAMYPVTADQKLDLLIEVIKRERPAKGLIFTATREATSELALALRRQRWEVVSLSSLLSQANRERALDAYRRGEFRFLVATDVAARGLDITDIDLVVNYDVPMQPEDYVHRIGRTGRMDRSGRAITLVSERDEARVGEIERVLGAPIERVELAGFNYAPRKALDRSGRGRGRAGGSSGGAGASGSRRPSNKGMGGRRRSGGASRPSS